MSENVLPIGTKRWGGTVREIPLQTLAIRRPAPFAIALGLAGGYAYLLAWFNRVDFYHNDFFVPGPGVTGYQIARLIFIPYFVWTIYCAGAFASLLVFGRAAGGSLPPWERYPLFFIAGAGIWHVALFATGLAGFDIKPVAVALTLGTTSLSVPHLADCIRAWGKAISQTRFNFTIGSSLAAWLWLAIIAVSAVFLSVKGLYPGGGHDYYNHYFQFYNRVTETGSILPNDVWYQFYYSSGAGLYFLAMLLTDPLAPQLVTTGFIGCGACIVYALLRNATRSTLLPLIGVLLYIGVFVYTPGPHADMVEGGWGILQKVHELTAVLLLAVIWIVYRSFRNDVTVLGPWMLALHFATICIGLLTLPLTLLVGLYLGGYVAWFAVTRRWRMAVRPFAAGVTAVFCLLGLAAFNYHYTGFPSAELIVQFWPHADLEKVIRWGALLEVLVTHQGATGRLANADSISWHTVPLVATFLRLELWWPLFFTSTPFLIYQMRNKAVLTHVRARIDVPAWSALIWFCIVVIFIAVFGGGRSQPISFYRLSTFSYAPTLCLALMACHLAFAEGGGKKQATRSKILILGSMLAIGISAIRVFSPGTTTMVRQNFTAILVNARSLWTGQFSLKDAYQNQLGWSGSTPWGGIYPGIIEPWRIAGPRTRIWSFHIHSYCMLPDCTIQEFISERFSPSWQTIFFGEAEQAVKVLRSEGLNYFFFSGELGMSDPLKFTPLFSPSEIGKYLAIRWTDGTSYLLTWPSSSTKPIDRRFLAAYTNAFDNNRMDDPTWKSISDYIGRHHEHLQSFFLPWCTNCTGMDHLEAPALN